jgi:hypothetical protein
MFGRVVGLTSVGVLVVGCYSLVPATGPAPEVGKQMAFDMNDAGRVALGGSMGPEIAQIQGRLLARDSDYVVSVTAVKLLRAGGEQTWGGEAVRIKPAYISSMYERRYSGGRTLAATAIGAGLVAAVAVRSILGGGAGGDVVRPADTSQTQRIPRP